MQLFQVILALIFGLQGSQVEVNIMLWGRCMPNSCGCYEAVESVRSVQIIGEKQVTVKAGYGLPSEPFPGYGCEPKPRDPRPGDGDRRSEGTTWGQIKIMYADRGSSGTIGNDFNSQSDYGNGGFGGGKSGGSSGGSGGGGGGSGGSGGSGGGSGR